MDSLNNILTGAKNTVARLQATQFKRLAELLSSSCKLCEECLSLELALLSVEHDCHIEHDPPRQCSVTAEIGHKGQLKSWSIESCTLCDFLAKLLNHYDDPDHSNSIGLYWLACKCSRDLAKTYHYNLHWMRLRAPQTILSMYSGGKHKFVVAEAKGCASESMKSLETHSVDFSQIQKWLDFCRYHHKGDRGCEHLIESRKIVSNVHVIDCNNYLIVPQPTAEYVALSYLWGQSSAEIHQHSNKLPETLPLTIQDAITVTKNLGFRYLWIDRYCINQQDEQQAQTQMKQMDAIYNNAVMTIIAAAGNDPSYGLPGVSKRGRTEQPRMEIGAHVLINPLFHTPDNLKHCHWSSRGWTYQEGLLSRRRLIFNDEQTYFECRSMYCLETLLFPLEKLHTPDLRALQADFYWVKDEISSADQEVFVGYFPPGVGKNVPQLYRRIEEYSKRQLSHQSDRLNGFLGILAAFENHGVCHWYGTPIVPDQQRSLLKGNWKARSTFPSTFVLGLCWSTCNQTSSSRSSRIESFPSWAWTGWSGPIAMAYFSRGLQFPHAEVAFELENGATLKMDEFRMRHPEILEKQLGTSIIQISGPTLRISRFVSIDLDDPSTTKCRFEMSDGWFVESHFIGFSGLLVDDSAIKAVLMGSDYIYSTCRIFVLILGDVGHGLERVTGGWVDPSVQTRLYSPDDVLIDGVKPEPIEGRYGEKWHESIKSEQETHRVR